MRVLQLTGPKQLAWHEAPTPSLASDVAAIVRPIAVASCDLDWPLVAGEVPFPYPVTLGHEFVGIVTDIGDEVARVNVGDRVVVAFQPSCGHCAPCRRGTTSACTSVPKTSMYGVGSVGGEWGGAIADFVAVPFADHMCVVLPANVKSVAAVSAGDNLADAHRMIAPHLVKAPESVLIAGGLASIPLYALLFAKALGINEVSFASAERAALDHAEQLGANCLELEKPDRRLGRFDLVVDCANQAELLHTLIRCVNPGGVCASASMYFEGDVKLPLYEMYMKGVSFHTGRVDSSAHLNEIVALLRDGVVDPLLVDTSIDDWEHAPTVFAERRTAKAIVVRDEGGSV